MTGPTGVKRCRPPRSSMLMRLCVPMVCVMFKCTCKRGWISSGLIMDVSVSLPVFEDGIKACDEKVRNVRDAANSEREKKKSPLFGIKPLLIYLDGQVFACVFFLFFCQLGFFSFLFFFSPPLSRPKRLCSMIYGEFLWSEAAAQTSGGFKSGVLAIYLH